MSDAQQPEAALVKADPERVSPADLHRHEMSYFRGVRPEDPMNKMWAFAMAIKDSRFVPQAAKGDAGSVFLMINRAAEMGLNWTVAVNGGLYPIPKQNDDGSVSIRLGIEGHAALSLLLGRKFKCEILQSDEKISEWKITRPDESFTFKDSFTIVEANNLGLLKKKNWAYPKDMLRWRAFMRVARIVAADVLGGVYLPEELDSVDMEPGPSGWQAANADKAEESRLEETYTVGRKEPGDEPQFKAGERVEALKDGTWFPGTIESAHIAYEINSGRRSDFYFIVIDDASKTRLQKWGDKFVRKVQSTPKPDVPPRDTTLETTPEPTPEPVEKPKVVSMDNGLRASVTERWEKIIASIPLPRRRGTSKLSDEEQAKKDRSDRLFVINSYMKAYFGVETLKEVATHINRAHEALDQWEIAFQNNPEITCHDPGGIAKQQAADRISWERLMEELSFTTDDSALAWKVKVAMQHATEDQAQYLKAMDVASLSAGDLHAFLRLASTDKRQAGKLLNVWRAAKTDTTFSALVANIEEKMGAALESTDPDQLSKRVATAIEIIESKPALKNVHETAAEEPAQPETSAAEEVGGLLFGEGE